MTVISTRDASLAEGRRLQTAGDFAAAETIYRRLLAADRGDLEALHLLGVVSHQRGDHLGAVAAIREVLAARPDFTPAWQNLVLPLVELGRLDEAIDCGRRAVAGHSGQAGRAHQSGAGADPGRPARRRRRRWWGKPWR